MTDFDHDPTESDLRALFDATSEAPTGAQLTKLRARSADVPARRRRSVWLIWAPFLAIAAGFFAVVVLRGDKSDGGSALLPSTANASLTAPSVANVAPSPAPAIEPAPDDAEIVVPDLAGADDGPSMDVLAAPLDDADDQDLDRWLAAADSYLEEG
jgi:hypothetical protein